MNIFDITSITATVASLIGAIGTVFYAAISFAKLKRQNINNLETEATETLKRISPVDKDATAAERQYLLMREYHAQGLAQSKASFWFSLIFASLGFAVIVSAAVSLQPNEKVLEQGRTIVTLIAGTVIDAVAALFFVQSNKARQLMVEFFDRLRNDQKLEESLRLVHAIENIETKSRLQSMLAIHFVDVKVSDSFLGSLIGIPEKNTST